MTTNGKPQLRIAALSDTGRTRSANQDYAYAGPVPGAEEWSLLAVADGLGGHARGEWASQRTIELFAGSLATQLEEYEPQAALEAAVSATNATVNHEARQQGSPGAATTLVAALVRGGEAWWINVGDSRLYRLSGGEMAQVSVDHSWVGDQVRAGMLPPEAMRGHPNKNVVTRTVGFEPFVNPETGGPLALEDGDALVLCSDGLHGPVEDADIARMVFELDPQLAAERLVQMANDAGGPDNITVVIGRMDPATSAPAATQIVERPVPQEPLREPRRRRNWRPFAGGAALLLLAGAAAAALYYLL